MSTNSIFNSISDPIPTLRRDLQVIPIQENGSSYLYFHDERGYATPDLALQQQVGTLLNLIDGQQSIEDLESYLGDDVTKEDLLDFIQFLDKNRLLASDHLEHHAKEIETNYEHSSVHESVTAGASYPADPEQLTDYLDQAFSEQRIDPIENAKALYAPHIDPRVALDSYVKAFAPIRNLNPKRVVILATSHYAGLYPEHYKEEPFILVDKDFELPLGSVKRDQKSINKLRDSGQKFGITTHDRAHRMEHSIELHLLFLSYLWDHDFSIVPFLTRGLDDLYYMEDGHLGKQLNNFSTLLNQEFGNDGDTFFLISGDLAHFGKKFGDQSAASTMFDEVEGFDEQFLDYGSANKKEEMLNLMQSNMDSYRICGFPPLYTFLQSMPDLRGSVLSYDLWDQQERDSAVTFGSILYS
ncbi:AmmeMemoRadiSam system protein B [Fodinibius salinus]|uniref:AmmeMemoRadiSam system protein B n=1 Tax=Fodinibius salinus TaxID=860790 RepID=A0A5D3YM54_9BACT|nr:AmmeMemoRadiSam system protein B [Fodinibius salinus]TYP94016.1 AmmeMemoRadiSam system protein B [Fodinibius salinus]